MAKQKYVWAFWLFTSVSVLLWGAGIYVLYDSVLQLFEAINQQQSLSGSFQYSLWGILIIGAGYLTWRFAPYKFEGEEKNKTLNGPQVDTYTGWYKQLPELNRLKHSESIVKESADLVDSAIISVASRTDSSAVNEAWITIVRNKLEYLEIEPELKQYYQLFLDQINQVEKVYKSIPSSSEERRYGPTNEELNEDRNYN